MYQPALFGYLSIILYLSVYHCQEYEYVIRPTLLGAVRGYSVPLVPSNASDTRRLDAFVGVPYAAPPVGSLRWQLPLPAQPWDGVYNATSFSACCSQDVRYIQEWSFGPDFNNTSEDCLYLNVFAPREQEVDIPSVRYPVLVWIHGGANRYGCGEEYDSRILVRQDVVVVTLNYRLGILGFLTTDDEVAPGNYGLHDQVLALQWVQENIAAFRGDPTKVTIAGNSAGGADVSMHLFSPLAQGLFSGVVEQSGAATAPWALYRPPLSSRPSTVYLAEEFSCPTDNSQAMVDCLLQQDADELVYTYVPSPSPAHSAWAPRVDGHYIVDTPEALLERGEFARVTLLSGTVPDECAAEYPGQEAGWSREQKEAEMYSRSRRYGEAADRVFDAMVHEYDAGGDDPQQQRDLFIELRTDNEYISGHDLHVRGHSVQMNSTYLYNFAYRAANHSSVPEWMGVPHFEECYYLFGVPLWPEAATCPWGCLNVQWFPWVQWNANDTQMSRYIMQAWTNFAKTGDPSFGTTTWPVFEKTQQFYVEFNHSISTGHFYKFDRSSFNNRYLPRLLNDTGECKFTSN